MYIVKETSMMEDKIKGRMQRKMENEEKLAGASSEKSIYSD